MKWIAFLGRHTIARLGAVAYLVAVAWTVLVAAFQSRHWPRPVRNVLARQILFTGYEATRFVSVIALLVGLSVVLQAQMFLRKVGQSELLGPILVMVLIRELGPLLTNFVVLGRSGTAMATEMASMKVNGEVKVLDAQGMDPFLYLVMPRILGMAISIFCLTIIFVTVAFLSGFASGLLLGAETGGPGVFVDSVFSSMTSADVLNLIIKSFVPGLLTGAICCTEGLSVKGAFTEIPQATSRAQVRSTITLFITSALVSLVTYL